MNETWLIATGRLTTPCQGDDSGISSPYESPPTIFKVRPRSILLLAPWRKYFAKCFTHGTQEKDEKGIRDFSVKTWRGNTTQETMAIQWEGNFKIYLGSVWNPVANSFEGALYWTFQLFRRREITLRAERLLASQDGLYFIEVASSQHKESDTRTFGHDSNL
jgi:hypothetical protein